MEATHGRHQVVIKKSDTVSIFKKFPNGELFDITIESINAKWHLYILVGMLEKTRKEEFFTNADAFQIRKKLDGTEQTPDNIRKAYRFVEDLLKDNGVKSDCGIEYDRKNKGRQYLGGFRYEADILGDLINVPFLPSDYHRNQKSIEEVRSLLVNEENQPVAIWGMPGIGKTLLAATSVRNEEIQKAFPDGIYWLDFRRPGKGDISSEPIDENLFLRSLQKDLAHLMEIESFTHFDHWEEGRRFLKKILRGKKVLIVLDNIWTPNQFAAFDCVSPPSRMLFTTRDRNLVTVSNAAIHRMEIVSRKASLQILRKASRIERLPTVANEIAERCGYLPLALILIGRSLVDEPVNRWDAMLANLKKRNAELEKTELLPCEYESRSFFSAMEECFFDLPKKYRTRFSELLIFPEATQIPEYVLIEFWRSHGVPDEEGLETLSFLAKRSVIMRRDNQYWLHDLVREFLFLRFQDHETGFHRQFMKSITEKFENLEEGIPQNFRYYYEWIPYHLKHAQMNSKLKSLLTNPQWLQKKLKICGVLLLQKDFLLLPEDVVTKNLGKMIQLSSPVLEKRPQEFSSQIHGRKPPLNSNYFFSLFKSFELPKVIELPLLALFFSVKCFVRFLEFFGFAKPRKDLDQVIEKCYSPEYWLRPLHQCLDVINGRLVQKFPLENEVRSLCLAEKEKKVFLSTSTGKIESYDLNSIQFQKTYFRTKHPSDLLNISFDEDRIAFEGNQQELFLLNTRTKAIAKKTAIPCQEVGISSLAHHSLNTVVALHQSGIMKLFDVFYGVEYTLLENAPEFVMAAISIREKQVRVFHVTKRRELVLFSLPNRQNTIFKQPPSKVTCIAISPDGSTGCTGHFDGSLRIWALPKGEMIAEISISDSGISNCSVVGRSGPIFCCDDVGKVFLWFFQEGISRCIREENSKKVTQMALKPMQKSVAFLWDSQEIEIWDYHNQKTEYSFKLPFKVKAMAFSGVKRQVTLCDSEDTLHTWAVGPKEEGFGAIVGAGVYGGIAANDRQSDDILKEIYQDLLADEGELSALRTEYNFLIDAGFSPDGTLWTLFSNGAFYQYDQAFLTEKTQALDLKVPATHLLFRTPSNLAIRRFYGKRHPEITPPVILDDVVEGLSISPKSQRALMGTRKYLYLFEIGKRVFWRKYSPSSIVKISNSGMVGITVSPSGDLSHWNLLSSITLEGDRHHVGHDISVIGLHKIPHSEFVISGSFDELSLWNYKTIENVWNVYLPEFFPRMRTSRKAHSSNCGRYFCMIVAGVMCVWHVESGKVIFTYRSKLVVACCFTSNGELIFGSKGWIASHDLARQRTSDPIQIEGMVDFLKEIETKKIVVSTDLEIIIMHLDPMKKVAGFRRPFREGQFFSEKLIRSEHGIIAGRTEKTQIALQRIEPLSKPCHLNFDHGDLIGFQFLTKERLIISSSGDGGLTLWDLETLEKQKDYIGHSEKVVCFDFTSKEDLLVSGSQDRTIKLWDLKNGNEIANFTGDFPYTAVVAGNDGRHFIGGDEAGRLHFLRLEKGKIGQLK